MHSNEVMEMFLCIEQINLHHPKLPLTSAQWPGAVKQCNFCIAWSKGNPVQSFAVFEDQGSATFRLIAQGLTCTGHTWLHNELHRCTDPAAGPLSASQSSLWPSFPSIGLKHLWVRFLGMYQLWTGHADLG